MLYLETISWVPCSRALPVPSKVQKLVFDETSNEVSTGYYDGEWKMYNDDPFEVTYWAFMPGGPG